jgi:hypothetical protein
MTIWPTASLDAELRRVTGLVEDMVDRYTAWGDEIRVGEIHFTAYDDIIDFANFRIETAASAVELLRAGRVADALGLCRSLLENYLLLILMCRGRRFFRLKNLESKTPEEFAAILEAEKQAWQDERASGASQCLDVRRYPRAKRHIMYVFDGLRMEGEGNEDVVLPLHRFQFQGFRPETLRLRPEDYFDYFPPDEDLRSALRGHRAEAEQSYRHYLSYDALLECLSLNDIIEVESERRIEAHYTFLGRFLHPTHDAARQLRSASNVYDGKPAVGMHSGYAPAASLLGLVYTAFLVAGVLDEVMGVFEAAPSRYIAEAGTSGLRSLTAKVPETIRYFWFVFNEASSYDRFNWAVHYATDEQLAAHGGYAGLPSDLIPFTADIFGNIQQALGGWRNERVGPYAPPIAGS